MFPAATGIGGKGSSVKLRLADTSVTGSQSSGLSVDALDGTAPRLVVVTSDGGNFAAQGPRDKDNLPFDT